MLKGCVHCSDSSSPDKNFSSDTFIWLLYSDLRSDKNIGLTDYQSSITRHENADIEIFCLVSVKPVLYCN